MEREAKGEMERDGEGGGGGIQGPVKTAKPILHAR